MSHYISAQDAITKAGSVMALARILGVFRQSVQQYRKSGIPQHHMDRLYELRPEWFPKQGKRGNP